MTDNPFTAWVLPPQPAPGDPQERVGDSDFPLDYFTPEGASPEFTPPQPTLPTIQKEASSYNRGLTPPITPKTDSSTDLRRIILRNLVNFLDIRLKHQAGRHNQKRHGWRYGVKPGAGSVGGAAGLERARRIAAGPTHRFHDEAKRIVAASISLRRTPEAGEHIEYRKRAGLVSPPPNIHTVPAKTVAAPPPAPTLPALKPKKPRVPKPKPAKPAGPTVDIPYRPSMDKQKEIYAAVDDHLRSLGIARKDLPAARASLEAELKTIVDRSPLVIRAPGDAAAAIIADGRWKSQFESGTSRGSFTPSYRSTAEYEGMGVPMGISKSKRPIYGYLKGATNAPGEKSPEATNYGEVIFNLKPATRNRATFTMGDSLGGFGNGEQIGTPVVKPNLGSMSKSWVSSYITKDYGSTKPRVNNTGHSYFEAQIHGGVKLTDVASVSFTSDCFRSSGFLYPQYAAMESALKAKGIEVKYASSEH